MSPTRGAPADPRRLPCPSVRPLKGARFRRRHPDPGASANTADFTHAIQQELATAFGQAAKELTEKLALDTTGMSGADEVFAITKALIQTAEAQGIKADVNIITAVALDVAQAAYRATLNNLESGLVALASAIESAGGLKLATTLVVDGIEALAPKLAA